MIINNVEYNIYKSYDKFDDRKYLILELNNNYYFYKEALNDNYRKCINNEIEAFRNIKSNNIPKIVDYEKDKFCLTEFIDGKILKHVNFTTDESLKIILKLLNILKRLEFFGYIHNDIKSNNIMIDKNNNIYLIDFSNFVKISTKGYYITYNSASPELINKEELDIRSEIYSIGVLLYELITGKNYFEKMTKEEILKLKKNDIVVSEDVPLKNIIEKCMKFDKNERYQTYDELIKDIRNNIVD